MKKILGLLAVLVLSVAAFGQTTYGVVAQGGTISGGVTNSPRLSASSTIGVVIVNNTFPYEYETGTIVLTVGSRVSGSMQVGQILGSGGTITVTTANEGVLFSGAISAGATWTPAINPNSTHFYILNGAATDALGNTLTFTLTTTTDASVTCFFSGSETISSLRLGITIN